MISNNFSFVQGEVDLQESDISLAQRHWNSRVAKNYREQMAEIKKKGKRPKWMSEAVWNKWVDWWATDEFKVNL